MSSRSKRSRSCTAAATGIYVYMFILLYISIYTHVLTTCRVSELKEDEVKKLYGGGDWHMAYICLYQRTDKVLGANSTRY